MSTKMRRLLLMACAMCPTWAGALGLGEIHLRSALDEPLNADIDLIAATPDELTSVHAELAPVSEYTRFGVDHPAFLSSFHFQVVKAADGHSVLRVTSTDSIPEPFVTFLIEVDWSRGHLMREYTVLLDPPVYASGHRAEPPAPVAMPSAAPPRRASRPEALPPAAPASSAPAAAPVAAGGTYQVGPGDTLTRIAQKLGASGQGAIDQTMLALFRANPDAFGGNVNLLHRGAILRVPDADRIAAVQERDAIAEIDRQMSAWRSGNAASGRLRLVAPGSAANAAGNAAGAGTGTSAASAGAGTAALRAQVKDLEGQLATERHLLELRNNELAALQAKLGMPPTAAAPAAPAPAAVPPPAPVPPASA
ncbi:MAG: hypothetical protein KGL34_13535, partial [Gammaproteobacteria bacterium]|nr:hypothetical protein [Gammaproteobacteria bacterium]